MAKKQNGPVMEGQERPKDKTVRIQPAAHELLLCLAFVLDRGFTEVVESLLLDFYERATDPEGQKKTIEARMVAKFGKDWKETIRHIDWSGPSIKKLVRS